MQRACSTTLDTIAGSRWSSRGKTPWPSVSHLLLRMGIHDVDDHVRPSCVAAPLASVLRLPPDVPALHLHPTPLDHLDVHQVHIEKKWSVAVVVMIVADVVHRTRNRNTDQYIKRQQRSTTKRRVCGRVSHGEREEGSEKGGVFKTHNAMELLQPTTP